MTRAAWLITAGFFCGAYSAQAAPPQRTTDEATSQPAEAPEVVALRYREQAEREFEAGRLESAIERWETSYEAFAEPGVLLGVGNAYWQLSRYEEAIRAYRLFLDTAPAGHPWRERAAADLAACAEEARQEEAQAQEARPLTQEGPVLPSLRVPGDLSPQPELARSWARRRVWFSLGLGGTVLGVVAAGLLLSRSASEGDTPAFVLDPP